VQTDIGRRTFLMALAVAGPVAFSRAGTSEAQGVGVPAWVPAGFPAFYEDDNFSELIVHKQRNESNDYTRWKNDGGDTAQREGFTWFAIWLLQQRGIKPVAVPSLPWLDAVKLLENPQKPGEFRRHPDPTKDWSDPKNFSRDQQTPIVAALGGFGPPETLERLWSEFDKRGRVCQNGDSGGPDHQNLFWRARRTGQIEAFGEFLLAGMVESIAARGAANPDDVGDDLNFIVNLAAATHWRPTKTSEAAICEYVRTRPINYGCYLEQYRVLYKDLRKQGDVEGMADRIRRIRQSNPTPECHPIIGALRWYFRAEEGAPWGPAALYEQVIRGMFLSKKCD
jgi:hypothetical protein